LFCVDSYYSKERLAKIHKTEEIPREEGWVPTVAHLSSRGPNCDSFLANILKVLFFYTSTWSLEKCIIIVLV